MTTVTPPGRSVDTEAFDRFLRSSLAECGLPGIATWTISVHRRRSSFRLDAVDVVLDDGRHLGLVCKSTSIATVAASHRAAKPTWRHHPGREAWCYEHVLEPLDAGTAVCYGVDTGRRWLLLESVPGHPIAETADPAVWERAVGWLAAFHRSAVPADGSPGTALLLRADAEAAERSWVTAVASCEWERVATLVGMRRAFERAAAILADEPVGIVHGEWFPTNVLVDPSNGRICPVDWELAAWGPAAVDLAALTTGWPPARAREFVDLYLDGPDSDGSVAPLSSHRAWAAARVLGAVDRLGSAGRAPLERSFDWWAELTDAVAHLDEEDR